MSLTLNAAEAKKADQFSSVIRDSGKYVGVITRAEKLLSKNSVEGVGISFKTDDNQSANYLDLYTVKPDGEKLRGYNLVQAILCCTRTKDAKEGSIQFEKWDQDERRLVLANSTGYPALMGKRIGLVLQRELGTNQNTGGDTDRMNIVGVFEPSTELTSTEILENRTKPERLAKVVRMIELNPVRDTRKRTGAPVGRPITPPPKDGAPFDDDIPF